MTPPLSADVLNGITGRIITGAMDIHKALGPGLLEGAYLACLVYELQLMNLHIDMQVSLPLVYRTVKKFRYQGNGNFGVSYVNAKITRSGYWRYVFDGTSSVQASKSAGQSITATS